MNIFSPPHRRSFLKEMGAGVPASGKVGIWEMETAFVIVERIFIRKFIG